MQANKQAEMGGGKAPRVSGSKFIYTHCPECKHPNVHVIKTTGRIAVHYTHASVPYACRGSLKQAPEHRDTPISRKEVA